MHLGGDAGQLLLTPPVGLLEVDGGAEEGTRQELVALTAARIGLWGLGEQIFAQEVTDPQVGRGGLSRSAAQRARGSCTERAVAGCGGLDQVGEITVLGRELDALRHARLNLAPRAHQTPGRGGTQRLDVAVQCRRDLGHSGGQRQPVRVGLGVHQVEDVADPLQRGGQDVEAHLVDPGRVGLLVHAKTLLHRRDGDVVDVIGRGGPGKGVEGLASEACEGRMALGREVVEILLVTGNPQRGGGDGTELDQRVEVVVRDVVNLGRGARFWRCVSGHPSNVPQEVVAKEVEISAREGRRAPAAGSVGVRHAEHPSGGPPRWRGVPPACLGMAVGRVRRPVTC